VKIPTGGDTKVSPRA